MFFIYIYVFVPPIYLVPCCSCLFVIIIFLITCTLWKLLRWVSHPLACVCPYTFGVCIFNFPFLCCTIAHMRWHGAYTVGSYGGPWSRTEINPWALQRPKNLTLVLQCLQELSFKIWKRPSNKNRGIYRFVI